ncbi:hypothetical protein T01_1050 [Trichinella spiralis]|uniref:Uncharacterized protein n=1 Tax=Trichinella spiralis TaxID=6334 RepID=A0A0V1BG06_TRISP|nr:hypothetical protein T01_1050 [Trichinella spiralis]
MAQVKAIKEHADSRQYYKYHVSVLVSFRNRGICSPDCHDWSVLVRSSPLYKRTHGEDIFICTCEMRMGWLPDRLLNRLSRAKLIRAVCTDGDIVFNAVRRHVIVVRTEGGCDCLSDANRLVCSLFLNVRPRSTLSTVFYISYQPNLSLIVIPIELDGELVEGSLMAFIHQLELCISIYLSHFIHHALHPFSKNKMERTSDCSNSTRNSCKTIMKFAFSIAYQLRLCLTFWSFYFVLSECSNAAHYFAMARSVLQEYLNFAVSFKKSSSPAEESDHHFST